MFPCMIEELGFLKGGKLVEGSIQQYLDKHLEDNLDNDNETRLEWTRSIEKCFVQCKYVIWFCLNSKF
jgi:hypothetical protein